MGRMDIFDKFRIVFDQRKGWIDFVGTPALTSSASAHTG